MSEYTENPMNCICELYFSKTIFINLQINNIPDSTSIHLSEAVWLLRMVCPRKGSSFLRCFPGNDQH